MELRRHKSHGWYQPDDVLSLAPENLHRPFASLLGASQLNGQEQVNEATGPLFAGSGLSLPVPPARFVQWRAVLHAGNLIPRLDSVLVNFLPKNVAPVIDDATVQIGMRYPTLPKQPSGEAPQPAPIRDRDSISVKWTAHDDNDDDLIYSVYYRGDGEARWLLLEDNITERYYSFDAGLLPDGGYNIKVVASDSLSHSPGEELSA